MRFVYVAKDKSEIEAIVIRLSPWGSDNMPLNWACYPCGMGSVDRAAHDTGPFEIGQVRAAMAWVRNSSRMNGLRVLLFAAIFSFLAYAWDALRGSPLEYWVIHDLTVRPSAVLINLLTPDTHAQAQRFSLVAPGGGLNILNGCEGLEALFLLVAAFAVAPLKWMARSIGIVFGALVVFVVNQMRILGLFYAYRADPAWFDLLHGNVAPVAVVLVVCAYFYAWLYFHQSTAAEPR
jgi:exosortase family protein XrtM